MVGTISNVLSGLLLALCLPAVAALAQEESSIAAASLAAAKELSAASGRPIFAIAGRST